MATDMSYGIAELEEAIEALKKWHEFQSSDNTNSLYETASKLFKSNFNPAEYDDVE